MCIYILLFCVIYGSLLNARSYHRPPDPQQPALITGYLGQTPRYILYDSHLQEAPFMCLFDRSYFFAHLLPPGPIQYRYNSQQSVMGNELSVLIEQLIEEILGNKKEYTDFTILKKRNFDMKHHTGLMILKFKKYPFILKLFIETPSSFIHPYAKGFEPCCFFMMGGGINRHLSGFTRIKNLENLRQKIQQSPEWSKNVDFPRKWFWLPSKSSWLELTTLNIGNKKKQSILIPATYAIVCDEIAIERTFTLSNPNDRQIALSLSNYLHMEVDPHINNYVIEKNTHKIVPIDSEHFPSIVGIENTTYCTSYTQWYCQLSFKMIKDTFGRTKAERRISQYKHRIPL